MSDSISRQVAIDVIIGEPTDAQPEVIHCKDCKHYRTTNAFGVPLHKEEYFCDADNYPKNDPGEEQRELPEWWFCAGAQTERSGSYDSLNGKRKEDEG